jgi:hypothetical protein
MKLLMPIVRLVLVVAVAAPLVVATTHAAHATPAPPAAPAITLRVSSAHCVVGTPGTTSCKTRSIPANASGHHIWLQACAPDGHYADWQVKDANNGVIVGQGRVPAGGCNSRYIFGLYGSYWGWVFNTRRGASMYLDNG